MVSVFTKNKCLSLFLLLTRPSKAVFPPLSIQIFQKKKALTDCSLTQNRPYNGVSVSKCFLDDFFLSSPINVGRRGMDLLPVRQRVEKAGEGGGKGAALEPGDITRNRRQTGRLPEGIPRRF